MTSRSVPSPSSLLCERKNIALSLPHFSPPPFILSIFHSSFPPFHSFYPSCISISVSNSLTLPRLFLCFTLSLSLVHITPSLFLLYSLHPLSLTLLLLPSLFVSFLLSPNLSLPCSVQFPHLSPSFCFVSFT